MTMRDDVVHPKVTDGRPTAPVQAGRRVVLRGQRDLVLASLVRCPEHRRSAQGKKGV